MGAPSPQPSCRVHLPKIFTVNARHATMCITIMTVRHECATDFMISIFADPIYKGDWPASVKERSPPHLLPITPDLVRPSSCALSA